MDTTQLNRLAATNPNARTPALQVAYIIENWDDAQVRRDSIAWMQSGYGAAMLANWSATHPEIAAARDWLQEQTLAVTV